MSGKLRSQGADVRSIFIRAPVKFSTPSKKSSTVKKKETITKYDATASSYEELYGEEQEFKYDAVVSFLHKKLDLALDLGCGTGMFLSKLGDFASEMVGADVSRNMLAKAKFKGAHLVLADAENLPFKQGVFDSLFAITVLQLVPNFKKALQEIRRVLKDKGIFVCSFIKKAEESRSLLKELESFGFEKVKVIDDEALKDIIAFTIKC